MRYVFAPSLLRLARWCAAGWCATATTPTPTCSAAPSATLAWAASVCTRTACSPTAAGTHGWRTASSASAWWVLTHAWTPHTFVKLPSQEFSRCFYPEPVAARGKTTYAVIPVPPCPHKKCNKYSGLHGNAHEWEMCPVKTSQGEKFCGEREGGAIKRRIGRLQRGENEDCFSSRSRRRKAVSN